MLCEGVVQQLDGEFPVIYIGLVLVRTPLHSPTQSHLTPPLSTGNGARSR